MVALCGLGALAPRYGPADVAARQRPRSNVDLDDVARVSRPTLKITDRALAGFDAWLRDNGVGVDIGVLCGLPQLLDEVVRAF